MNAVSASGKPETCPPLFVAQTLTGKENLGLDTDRKCDPLAGGPLEERLRRHLKAVGEKK